MLVNRSRIRKFFFDDNVACLYPLRTELETNQKQANQLKNSKSKNRLKKEEEEEKKN